MSGTIVKAPPTGGDFSAAQVAQLMQQMQQRGGNNRAKLMPRPDTWSTDPFGPGRPLPVAPINVPRPDTGRADPRAYEYPVAENLQISGRRGHVPWATLQSAADQPLFRKCIQLRKSICDLEFAVTVDPKAVARYAELDGVAKQDVESKLREKYRDDIARVTDFFTIPDRKNGFSWQQWTGLIMENQLKYDAVAIWPQYTFGGDLFSLKVIDGKTIKPLQDEYGERPLPPFPAFQQILYGFPRGEWTATTEQVDGEQVTPGYPSDQLLYERRIIRSETPYGMSPTEIALVEGLLWSKRFSWMLAEYTEGVQPEAFLINKGELDWTPEQTTDYERYINQRLAGNTAERMKWPLLPVGVEPVQSVHPGEKYRADYDLFLIKLQAGCFGVPITELGFTETGALGATFHEGNEDVFFRQTRRPDAQWVGGIASKLARQHLRMPRDLQVQILGLESEDEAAADAVAQAQVASGRMTLNEERARRGLPPYDFDEADMPLLETVRGIVFIEGASLAAPPGVLVGPAQAPPAGPQDGTQPPQDGAQPPAGKPAAQDANPPAKPAAKPAAKAIAAKHVLERTTADEVYAQLAEDYPAASLPWVLTTQWDGPCMVPLADIDTSGKAKWRASSEPEKVDAFADKIQEKQAKGKQLKPVILVCTPGASKAVVIDGHHRTLAYDQLDQPVWAYVGTVAHKVGPWDQLHDYQFGGGHGAGDAPSTDASKGVAVSEVAAFRRSLARRLKRPGQTFEFTAPRDVVLKVAPELADDARAVFKYARPPAPGGPPIGTPVRWEADPDACDECRANEDKGVIPYGTVFPGGEIRPEQHPNCKCALVNVETGKVV